MESTPIYKGWKRYILSLWCQMLAFDLTQKDPNCWLKVVIMVLKSYYKKKLVGLAILEWCHNCYNVNRSEMNALECSRMSDHHLRASFVKFSREMKHQMP
jgi:hypothetical protein